MRQPACLVILWYNGYSSIQSIFNGSNTFGAMKISSRQGSFEPVMVDYSARSGGFILTVLDFL